MQASLRTFAAFSLLLHGPVLAAGAGIEDIVSLVQIGLKKELGRISASGSAESEESSSRVSSHASQDFQSPMPHKPLNGVWDLLTRTLAGVDRAAAPHMQLKQQAPQLQVQQQEPANPVGFVSIQAKEVQENPVFGSFLSMGGHFCAEGLLQSTKGVLVHRKASVQGSLYRDSQVSNQTCADRGFNLKGGSDSCFPGLKTFFREREDHAAFLDEESRALSAFQATHKLSARQAGLMAACMCHPDSIALGLIGHHCEGLKGLLGAWVHRNPETKEELICSEGPLSSPGLGLAAASEPTMEFLMQGRDTVSPTSCAQLGFPVQLAAVDRCLPGLSMWTKENSAVDQGLAKLSMMEEKLATPRNEVGLVACALRALKALP